MAMPFERADLMAGIPRGNTDKHIDDQKIPKAFWYPQRKLEQNKLLDYDPNNPNGAMLWGAVGDKLKGYKDDRHAISIAGNRAGKSITATANMFFWDGSLWVIDPKGEHAMRCAMRRHELGDDVYIIDPYHRVTGPAAKFRAKYNELKTLDIDSLTVIEDARRIIDANVIKSVNAKDPHWDQEAENIILGILLFVAFGSNVKEDYRHMCFVREIILGLMDKETYQSEDGPTQHWVWKENIWQGIQHLYWEEKEENGQKVLVEGKNADIAKTIWGLVNGFFEKADDERSGVHSNAKRHTSYLDNRAMKEVKSGHDFDLKDLKKRKVSVFVVLPANRLADNAAFLRTFINQLIDAVEGIPNKPGQHSVLAVCDEFPVLGYLKALEDAIGQIAGFGLKLHIIVQDKGQIDALYGKRAESFIANAGVVQVFANTDLTTLKYIGEKLGNSPVGTNKRGETTQSGREQGLGGQSDEITMYPLATPDELARQFSRADIFRRQIIMIAGYHPIIMSRVVYFDKNAPYAPVFEGVYEEIE